MLGSCIGKMTTAAPLPELLQAKLQLFGSTARGEFAPAHSDLDFIVQMKGRREQGYAAPVDLLTELMIANPYFKAAIAQERTVLLETAH
jgi:predicted nucleotidyltransferase